MSKTNWIRTAVSIIVFILQFNWLKADWIKTDKNDLIVFHNIGTRLFFGVVSAISAWFVYVTLGEHESSTRLFFIFVGVSLVAGFICLTNKTVTIDKKSRNIIFQTNFPIKCFKSVKKIPFSALEEIKVTTIDTPDGIYSSLELIEKNTDKPVYSYSPNWNDDDAITVARKIHGITGKRIVEEARRID